jgi:anthraniloyl-CoA monooxygenase
VKVEVVGAGPAGLYLSILMKAVDRRHEITVRERNPPDATFGWGVVFSEGTLGGLRDADLESFTEITESFATWDTIEMHYGGHRVRSRGHAFSAISRKVLLGILQRRAAGLGVDLRFEEEVGDVSALDADLVVGADGVNSMVRSARAEALGPSITPYPSRFVWFGTDLVFDAFTFLFRETEHGMFQAHAYPFDAETSTFIVECNEDVWRRAGLEDRSEEETLAFCHDLFADHLGQHRLMSNRSVWLSFLSVKNRSWHDCRVVLLGDAAHTAHFSIGSGTKLALEDSIALSNAVVRYPGDIDAALVDYEMERQPVVERFQEAALDSARYFENVARYARFAPMQFAFNLLTRSGRITYTNLTLRDPHFVRHLDSWFTTDGGNGVANGVLAIGPPPMFAPLRLGEVTIRNRVVEAPVGEDAGPDGRPDAAGARRLESAARRGAGLVLTGLVASSPDGRTSPGCPTLHGDEQQDAWTAIVEQVHRAGSAVALQLGHAGRRGAARTREHGADLPLREGAWPLLSASALPYTPISQVPKAMDRADMDRVRDEFAAAAARAARAGFDLLSLHLAHGYLLHSFLSPLANRRDDEYGGSLENRLRFPLEVFDVVREAWGAERPIAACLSSTDGARGGSDVGEAVEIARVLRDRDCNLIHVAAGQGVAATKVDYRRGFLIPFSDRLRTDAGVATLVGGYITTADEINTVIGAGRADLCVLESAPAATRTGVEAER